jgi:hypothetical protein
LTCGLRDLRLAILKLTRLEKIPRVSVLREAGHNGSCPNPIKSNRRRQSGTRLKERLDLDLPLEQTGQRIWFWSLWHHWWWASPWVTG